MTDTQDSTRRLLVLDDENDVAATICMIAATAGYDTDHTDDPDVFLERIDSWAPTHVIVDLKLGGRDGIDVIHQLARMDCGTALIIASGLGGRILDSAARAAAENGLQLLGSLAKPFSRSALLDLLAADVSRSTSPETSSSSSSQANTNVRQLADALHAKELTAYFQPKISCANGDVLGFECLARWPQQDGSIVLPDSFISLAEETGLIHELSKQVYDYALANLASRAQGIGLKLALNLSLHNLNDKTFPNWLLEKCQEHGVEPEQVILEVTETASMNNPLTILENLTQFRIRGFHLSIDDFGVGYSSLVQLARLPFSELKIDQMFVKTLANSEESQKIVKSVVSLGHSMGLNVVAEGVEDLWALEFLHHIGCNEAQGYFIARPMDNLAATAWDGFSWNDGA